MDECPEGNDMCADRNNADLLISSALGAEVATVTAISVLPRVPLATFDILAHNDSA